jgi:AcrR family transcriptional regulator
MTTVSGGSGPLTPSGSARARLLQAADELFYTEGIHTVSIDRVIEHAGVAKASLYNVFGSKDQLIRAYLTYRHDVRKSRIESHVAQHAAPERRILAVFDALEELIADPAWSGCPFLAATGESRTDPTVREVCELVREFTRACFLVEAERMDLADPDSLADTLVLLHDGALARAHAADDVQAAIRAWAIATLLVF